MKKIILILILGLYTITAYSQLTTGQFKTIWSDLRTKGLSNDEIVNVINGLVNDPVLLNKYWQNFIKNEGSKWTFLKDMNIQFKTFQSTDNSTTALGFTYDFNYDYAKFVEKEKHRFSHTFGLSTKGNVAFNKKFNPTDFLETKLNYSFSNFMGGVIKKDTTIFNELNIVENKLTSLTDMQSPEAIALWEEFGRRIVLSNQYYYSVAPKFAFESNQNFSKTQFTP